MESTPETSRHTSIKHRTNAVIKKKLQPHNLMPFIENHRQYLPKGIDFSLLYYREQIDTKKRCIRADHINLQYCQILQELGLLDEQWLTITKEFEKHFRYAVSTSM